MRESNEPWYVYLLRCRDGSIYTGISNDVEARLREHNRGKGAVYTRQRRPVSVIFRERHPDQGSALRREAQIKNWSRQKKEDLVAPIRSESAKGGRVDGLSGTEARNPDRSIDDMGSRRRAVLVAAGALALLYAISTPALASEGPDGRGLQAGSAALTIGMPAILNLNLSHIGKGGWGWTVAGGYFYRDEKRHITGVQGGILRTLRRSSRHYLAASLHGGYWELVNKGTKCEYYSSYLGVGLQYKWRSLFVQIDLDAGKWDDDNLEPSLGGQVGIALKTFHHKSD